MLSALLPGPNPPQSGLAEFPSFNGGRSGRFHAHLSLACPLWLGWHEALAATALPAITGWFLGRGVRTFWAWLGFTLGLCVVLDWVPQTLALKIPVSMPIAILGSVLTCALEAVGPMLAVFTARVVMKRRGIAATALASATAMILWTVTGFSSTSGA